MDTLTTYRATVIICSDRAHLKKYTDESGPAILQWLHRQHYETLSCTVIPDEAEPLIEALQTASTHADLVIVCGGTGIGPRDITPQTIARYCDYEIPGVGELLRRESAAFSLNSYLGRGGAYVKNQILFLALPGNPKAVIEQLTLCADLLPRALQALRGQCAHGRVNKT